jgi:hypothetical protein
MTFGNNARDIAIALLIPGQKDRCCSWVTRVINFRTNYNLAQVKNVLAGKESVRPEG